jgi:hypothetical protein
MPGLLDETEAILRLMADELGPDTSGFEETLKL